MFPETVLVGAEEKLATIIPTATTISDNMDKEITSEEKSQLPVLEDILDRRWFLGATIIGAGALLGAAEASAIINMQQSKEQLKSKFEKLQWESTPINKRTGITVFDAEKAGYNVRFVTYLSRFLLAFDADCQKWWYSKAADIPRRATAEEVSTIRLKQFAAFAASVEVGLQEYEGTDGPSRLIDSLLARYCPPDMETVRTKRAMLGLPTLSEAEENKERREIKEARRQIALLFGLMEANQPVERINQLLAAIANGSVAAVEIEDGGSGYAPGYGAPLVTFPPPNAGPGYRTATGRALLKPNGRVLRLDLQTRGFGYQKSPTIIISSPGADRGVIIPGARAATAKAVVFKNGVNKGRLERIEIIDPGSGYEKGEKIRVIIDPPELPAKEGGLRATAEAIRELSVSGIEIVDGGSGYAVEKPIRVIVEPPPLTARVNMNDPFTVRIATSNPKIQQRKNFANSIDPASLTAMMDTLVKNDGKGGGGGCWGVDVTTLQWLPTRPQKQKPAVSLASVLTPTFNTPSRKNRRPSIKFGSSVRPPEDRTVNNLSFTPAARRRRLPSSSRYYRLVLG